MLLGAIEVRAWSMALLLPGPANGHDMRRAPGAERRRGLVARIDVDEDDALVVQRDRQPERKVAPEVPCRSPVNPPGQEPARC